MSDIDRAVTKTVLIMYFLAAFTVTNIHWFTTGAEENLPFFNSILTGIIWPLSGIVLFIGNIS